MWIKRLDLRQVLARQLTDSDICDVGLVAHCVWFVKRK